ncbi:MAG: hypothetical protein LUD02_04385 [Tannerellaceae bacterium]|nr:hypothetical protein [Tannerellaceae bacterium]MCD8263484.1 hypothetical protein [Tannerellaceae bacterium]
MHIGFSCFKFDIYDDGLVVGYTYIDYDNEESEVMIQLGRTFPVEDFDGNIYFNWIECIDAEYYPGEVTFTIRISDFGRTGTVVLPPVLDFKVVLVG